jgi:predicted GTPase
MEAISELYKENLISPKQNDSLGSTNSDSQIISKMCTVQDSSSEKFFIPEGKENLIIQNLKVSDEVLKLIVIGDKSVGKSLLIRKICEKTNLINSPTRR